MKPRWWMQKVSRDIRLSIEARWLLLWLGGQPAGWRYSVDEARAAAGVGREKYFRILAEIKSLGYVDAEHRRDMRGRITFTNLKLRDVASPECGKAAHGKPHRNAGSKDGGPECGKAAQTSLIDTTERASPEAGFPGRLRVISGGRDV